MHTSVTTRLLWSVALSLCFITVAGATDYTGATFIVRDPVTSVSGGYSASASFQHISSDGQIVVGEQTSASFIGRSGFLYFPVVTSPSVSAVAGVEQVSLSWTTSIGELGFTVSGYRVGRATSPGGPYSYTNVGNVTAAVETGLSGGTTYYFVVEALDAFGDTIAISGEVSSTPTGSGSGGGGGGSTVSGGAGDTLSSGSIVFYGYAHPNGVVRILRDGNIVREMSVGADGTFSVRLENISFGTSLFTIYGVDETGVRSGLLSFPVSLSVLARTASTRVFIPPTIGYEDGTSSGEDIVVVGHTVPGASVGVIMTDGDETLATQTVVSDEDGRYSAVFPKGLLQTNSRALRSLAAVGDVRSPFGLALRAPVFIEQAPIGDFNSDAKVNLIDFSILAYWHNRTNAPAYLDLNGDGKINLVDFSILTYYWTG